MENSYPSDFEKYKAFLEVIDRVGVGLAKGTDLEEGEPLKEWVAFLEWGVKLLPEGYEKTRDMLRRNLRDGAQLHGSKTASKKLVVWNEARL